MKQYLRLLILLLVPVVLSSCSVAMAARKEGTSLESVQSSRTRGQLLSKGGKIILSERICTGELVEIYQFQMEKGSTGRAIFHGVMDVLTLGQWELIGTPLEILNQETKYYSVKVFYDMNETIIRMELA